MLTAFSLGAPGADTAASSVKLDSAGNQYVCGSFNGIVDFDPGPGTHNLTSTGSADAFVAEYSAAGQLLWVGQLVDSTANALTLDADGNVLVTGSCSGATDFDFGSGTKTLPTGTYGAGFVAKYTSDGGLVWADPLGGQSSGVGGSTIAVDKAGNVYSAGTMSNGSADMDPGDGTATLINSSGNIDTYISKLDASGNFVWAKKFTNDPSLGAGDWPEGMGVDDTGRVYISGLFVNRVNFDTSGGTHWVTAADGAARYGDGYVARLTATGDLDYIATMGSTGGRDDAYGIAVDSAGNAYVAGRFSTINDQPATPLTITPATGSGAQLPLAGGSDLFVLKLNTTGGLDWARGIGGGGFDAGRAIALGADGLYLAGDFSGTVDFDPNAGVQNVTGAGGANEDFILKLNTDSTFVNVWTVGGSGYQYSNDIAVNNQGDVAIVGRFQGSGDFEPGPGVVTLTSAGSEDAFASLLSQGVANRAPVAQDASFTVDEDTLLQGQVSATDADGDTLKYSIASRPTHGGVVMQSNGSFRYLPSPNYNGTDQFTYTVSDGKGGTATATVTITVNPVNDAPYVALNPPQAETTPEDTPLNGQVQYLDVEGDPVTITLKSGPANGTVTVNTDGSFVYTPNLNFNGVDTFTITATDSHGASRDGAVAVTVTPVNDPPVANDDTYTVAEDNTLTLSATPGSQFDLVSEPGAWVGAGQTWEYTPDTATFSADTYGSNGVRVSVDNFNWQLIFQPAGTAPLTVGQYDDAVRFATATNPGLDVYGNGRAENDLVGNFFVYDVTYAADGSVASFAARFTQQGVNLKDNTLDPPVHGQIRYNTTIGAGGGVLANDTDVEGDLLLASVVTGPAHGQLTFHSDGTFTYTPEANFNGDDTFTYRANDGTDNSNVATVTIHVTPVNDPPTAGTIPPVNVNEDAPPTTLDLKSYFSDVEDGSSGLTYKVTDNTNTGLFSDVKISNGALSLTYAPNANGQAVLTITATDSADVSVSTNLQVNVAAVNDLPVAAGQSLHTNEDTPLSGQVRATDVEGDTLTYRLISGPTQGQLTFNADGTFTYTPSANDNGSDSFTFVANDGQGDSNVATVAITVDPVNDAPTLSDATFGLAENTPNGTLVGTVTGSDVDGDALQYRILSGNTSGAFAIDPNTGKITVANSRALDYETTPVFTLVVEVRDGGGLTATAKVTINLTDVSDETRQVAIDIKPGDPNNQINPKSQGKIEVAILSSADFNALSIDVSSLRFGSTGQEDSLSRVKGSPRFRFQDVNHDGKLDLVVEFESDKTGFQPGDIQGVLTGNLQDGTTFTGTDTVNVKSHGNESHPSKSH